MLKKWEWINEKVGQLPNHQIIKLLGVSDLSGAFDATPVYPSTMWNENSSLPEIEAGYGFTEHMNYELINKLKN